MITDIYGKREAAVVSGITILLMICHHFFGFQNYLVDGNEWYTLGKVGGIEIERVFAAFGKICVSVYAFNSGYVLFKQSGKYRYGKDLFLRMSKFLVSYWLIYLLFLSVGFLTDSPLPSVKGFLANLIGLETGPFQPWVNVPFAWYVCYYLIFLAISPILAKIFSTKSVVADIIFFVAIHFAVGLIHFDPLSPLTLSLVGLICSKYQLITKLYNILSRFPSYVVALLLLILIPIRQGLILINLNWGGTARF